MAMLITNAGRSRIASALAEGVPISIAEIGFGIADRMPTGGEIGLGDEVLRKPVLTSGTDGTRTYFDARIEAPEGPWTLYELGVYEADGTLLFIGRLNGLDKLVIPDQPMTLDVRVWVLTSQFENVVVQVQSTFAYVPIARAIDGGIGISGGGDMSADRVLSLDLGELPAQGAPAAATYEFPGYNPAEPDPAQRHRRMSADTMGRLIAGTTWFRQNGYPGRYRSLAANATAVSGDRIAANVTGGPFTITLPASPATGDWVVASVVLGDAKASPVTLSGNRAVMGDAAGLILDVPLATVPLVYNGTEWRIA